MRGGLLSQLPGWAPHTAASVSSSTPLLPTPDAAEGGTRGGSQHPDKRAETNRTINLSDVVENALVLPTPMSGGNAKSARSMQKSKGDQRTGGGQSSIPGLDEIASLLDGVRPEHMPPDEELGAGTRELVEQLLPTPKTKDRASRGPAAMGGPDLGESVALLLTPTTLRGRHNGDGVPTLDGQVELLYSPTGSEGTGLGRGVRRDSTLRGQIDDLFPTPRATDGTNVGPGQRGSAGDLALPSAALSLLPTPTTTDMGERKTVEEYDEWTDRMVQRHGTGGHGGSLDVEARRLMPTPDAQMGGAGGRSGDPELTRAAGHHVTINEVAQHLHSWGPYEPAIRRWERVLGRPAPWATEPSKRSKKGRLSPRFVEWMQGWIEGWVTSLPLSRNQQLKILGNGVVPQQATEAVLWLLAPAPTRRAVPARRQKPLRRASPRGMLKAATKPSWEK